MFLSVNKIRFMAVMLLAAIMLGGCGGAEERKAKYLSGARPILKKKITRRPLSNSRMFSRLTLKQRHLISTWDRLRRRTRIGARPLAITARPLSWIPN